MTIEQIHERVRKALAHAELGLFAQVTCDLEDLERDLFSDLIESRPSVGEAPSPHQEKRRSA